MERMEALFDATNNRADVPMTRDQLAEAMATCDVLVPTVTDVIDAGLIEGAGEQLRLIANYGAGIDHIALQAARARHHRHPHPRRAHRGHRRHDDGADPRGAAPARRWRETDPTGRLEGLEARKRGG